MEDPTHKPPPASGLATLPDGEGEIEAPTRLGHFELGRRLGGGGMSVVFEARDTVLERTVALKLMRPDVARGAKARARLLREAQALARLKHPNVVTVFEVGTASDEIFIAMELVEGATLRDWMSRAHDWREVIDRFVALGRGLAAAHALGLVHRDVKPANVFLDRDGTPKIGDFGLVSATGSLDDDESSSGERTAPARPSTRTLTTTGSVMGTPAYMAPEQVEGLRADGRADQYAFCVSLHEALTGRRPDEGPPLRPIPPALRPILARGLEHAADARYPSMDALLAALTAARAQGRARRWRVAIAAAGLAVAAAIGWLALRGDGAPPPLPAGYRTGLWLLQRTDGRAAVAALAPVTRDDPGFAPAWIALARAYDLGTDGAAAKAAAARAVALVPERDRARRVEALGLQAELDEKHDLAIERYREYLGFVPDDVEVGVALADAQVVAGDAKGALATVKVLHARSDDPRLAILQARGESAARNWSAAEAAATHAVELSTARGAPLVVARALAVRGRARALHGDLAGGLDDLTLARRLADQLGDRKLAARVLTKRASVLGERGDVAGAAAAAEEAIAIDRGLGDDRGLASDLTNAAAAYGALGKNDRSNALYDELIPLLRKLDEREALANALGNHGADLVDQGQRSEGDRTLREALDVARAAGYQEIVVEALTHLGWNDFGRGDLAQAEAEYRDSLALGERVGAKMAVLGDYEAIARVLAARGDQAGALRTAARAVELAAQLDPQSLASARAWYAVHLVEAGDPSRAVTQVLPAIDVLHASQDDNSEVVAQAAAAAALVALGRGDEARPHVARAQALMARPISIDYRVKAATLLIPAAASLHDLTTARAIYDLTPREHTATPWASALDTIARRFGFAAR